MKIVKFYTTKAGDSPVEEFIDSLGAQQAQKVVWVLKLFEDLDFVPSQYFKKLTNTDDIWEVRIQLGNNIFRILGFLEGDQIILLTNGFVKKSQKTPKGEVEIAGKRKKEYESRGDE